MIRLAPVIRLGDLAGPTATVDATGGVTPRDTAVTLRWAVGTGDAWHRSDRGRPERLRRLLDTPVVDYPCRVAGGDVTARIASISGGGHRAVLVTITNETPTPVALAWLIDKVAGRVEVDGLRVLVDGRALVVWDRPIRAAALVAPDAVDAALAAGPRATAARGVVDPAASPAGAVAIGIVPLAAGRTVRALLAVGADHPLPADGTVADVVRAAPAPDAVARGWRRLADRAATVELPDTDLVRAWRRAVCDLVVDAGDPALDRAVAVAPLLDAAGLVDEGDRARDRFLQRVAAGDRLPADLAVAALAALCSRRLRAGRESGLAELAGPLVEWADGRLPPPVRADLAAVLGLEHPPGAADLAALTASDDAPMGPLGPGHEVVAALVGDQHPGIVDLLPGWQGAWAGGPVDVRGLCTRGGRVSFSLRWHGARPALLWEIEATPGAGPPATSVRASALDPAWTGTGSSGEALLAGPSR
ncbi:MAG: hypothetical protein D6683_13235 [Actinomyces sp.]|nr:MAG: hypothetical protein D6683_13235 [Actinomyces sp.]